MAAKTGSTDRHAADWSGHTMLLPPWRERLPDGRLGAYHGPLSMSEYERAWDHVREDFNAPTIGGLWDPEQEESMPYACSARSRVVTRKVQRADQAAVEEYMDRHSHEVSAREQEAYVLFYSDGRSYSACARAMSMRDGRAVYEVLKGLRVKVRAWGAARGL